MATHSKCARRILSSSLKQTRQYSAPSDGAIPPNKAKYVPSSGTYPSGFWVGSAHAQVKTSNTKFDDMALIASDRPCAAAAVFTRNAFQAAPVSVSRGVLMASRGKDMRGLIVNSGCANAVTGQGGLDDAVDMAKRADDLLRQRFPEEQDQDKQASPAGNETTPNPKVDPRLVDLRSMVMSTGVIGQRLPMDRITNKIPQLVDSIGNTHDHWLRTARAICTTDTFPKLLSRQFQLPSFPGRQFSMAGMTKGAGMIHPNMATLLGVICTDAPVSSSALRGLLKHATNLTFNCITVDGDTSTNDTVAIFANGRDEKHIRQIRTGTDEKMKLDEQSDDYKAFNRELTAFMGDLAKLIVRDGEGATKFVTIRVEGARKYSAAKSVASSIAQSALVKTALYGKDANWGRILCAIGYAPGQANNIVPQETSVSFVPTDGSEELKLLVNGEPEQVDEDRAKAILEMEDLEILVKLSNNTSSYGKAVMYTCDFSHEYVTINGDYRT